MASEAADWIELQNRFYRVHDVYQMQWENVELANHIVACAPFGGPMAISRDPSKLVQVGMGGGFASLQTVVSLFSAPGVLLATITWSAHGAQLVDMGWTKDLNLVLVAQDGSIIQYTLQGKQIPGRIGLDAGTSPIVKVAFFRGTGVICISEDLQVFIVPSFKEPQVLSFSPPDLLNVPSCLLCLAPLLPSTQGPDTDATPSALDASFPGDQSAGLAPTPSSEVPPPIMLIAVDSSLLVLNPTDGNCSDLSLGPVDKMALSPSGKLLGCFTMDGVLHVIVCGDSFDIVSQYDTKMGEPPDSMTWCGEDAVLAHWQASGSLLLVGPGDSATFPSYEDDSAGVALVLTPEVDGARVVSRRASAFAQRVPDPVVAVFGIGSTDQAALLYDAFEQFDRRSVKADESIRLLGDSMASAVETCTEAACHEPTPGSQQRLLRAAAYGRTYCRVADRDVVKSACMVLRVLNAIRDPEAAGVPLSYLQFKALGPAEVVTLLLAYHRHLLAMRISQHLGLPEERVLEHWASARIAAAAFATDDELYGALMARLGQERGARVSYARIAEVAHVRNRQRLAARLLEHEASEGRAVALLVRMRQFAVALRKAEACSDTDLLYLVLFQIQSHLPEDSLFQLLEAFPVARNLFIAHTRAHDRDLLRRFLTAWNKPHLVAELAVEDALVACSAAAANSHDSGGAWSAGVLRDLEEAARLYDATREHAFQGASLHEWVRLMKLEQKGENGMNASTRAMLQGKNVSDCLMACFSGGGGAHGASDVQQTALLQHAANRVRAEMRVPERRLYWVKLRALVGNRDWVALEKFSKERRPPIGFRAFAEACIDAGAPQEAAKYIAKIVDPAEREELGRRIGAKGAGSQGAGASGSSGDLLGSIRSTFGGSPAQTAQTGPSSLFKGWGFG